MIQERTATKARQTSETEIVLSVTLDGDGGSEIVTGVGFLDHMLTHIARHGLLHLTVQATGDQHIDDHHTVEDIGIALGEALREAAGNKAGIARYGFSLLPMDEALVPKRRRKMSPGSLKRKALTPMRRRRDYEQGKKKEARK